MLRRAIHGAAHAGLALAATMWLGGAQAHAGALEGQVVHEGSKVSLKGLPISVVFRAKDGGFDRASTTTAADGHFRVDGLTATGPHLVFVEYKDITYPPEMVEIEKPETTGKVRLEVFDPSDDSSKLRVSTLRTVVARGDAGTYRVEQQISLENTDRSVLRRAKDAPPLARFGLLPNRSGEMSASLGFTPAEIGFGSDGAAEFRGPIFPGQQWLTVDYEIDAGGRDLLTELPFPEAVASFELYVRDEGMAIFAEPLHPAQLSVQREQGKPVPYQHYLGFDVAAGTRIPLRLETLPEPGTSQLLAAAMVAILFGLLGVFVGMPVAEGARDARREREAADVDDGPSATLATALSDLEHDFEMGKVSVEDRERMREELRREAVEELARRRAAPARPARSDSESGARARPARASEAEKAVRFCSGCGSKVTPEARFCSSCGHKL